MFKLSRPIKHFLKIKQLLYTCLTFYNIGQLQSQLTSYTARVVRIIIIVSDKTISGMGHPTVVVCVSKLRVALTEHCIPLYVTSKPIKIVFHEVWNLTHRGGRGILLVVHDVYGKSSI